VQQGALKARCLHRAFFWRCVGAVFLHSSSKLADSPKKLTAFPPTHRALGLDTDAPGLLAMGGHLTPRRLQQAYEQGIFPWFSQGQPVLWWTPDPRMVLYTKEFKLSRSLRKTLAGFLKMPGGEIRFDSALPHVIDACAATPRAHQNGTWIGPTIRRAYCAWHDTLKAVHSVETWLDGQLIGGLYGVNLGRMFFGESMFSHRSDASKIALAALVAFCLAHDIKMIDCQQNTSHLASLGAREIPRSAFEAHLSQTVHVESIADWSYDPDAWHHLDSRLLFANF
jgi:leucyl/phenylalanyl-tRNA--protein transferase